MVNIILIKKKYVGHQRLPLVMQMCLGLVNGGAGDTTAQGSNIRSGAGETKEEKSMNLSSFWGEFL